MKLATRMAMAWHALKNPDKRGVQRHHGSDPAVMPATSCVCENSERFKHKHGQKRHVTFFGLFNSPAHFVYLNPPFGRNLTQFSAASLILKKSAPGA